MERYLRKVQAGLTLLGRFLPALALLGFARPAVACLNEAERIPTGAERRQDIASAAELEKLLHPPPFDTEKWQAEIAAYEQAGAGNHTHETANRYALALVYTGKYEQARDVWIRQEEEHPGDYATAANLGTAYELTGDNANALKWIKEGIARNPESHEGTEWLHVRILEAKLVADEHPEMPLRSEVSGIRFSGGVRRPRGIIESPRGNTGEPVDLAGLRHALAYQLKERLQFIREPEPIVAQLLVDLGDVYFLSNAPGAAGVAYTRATEYGASKQYMSLRLEAASKASAVRPGIVGWLGRYWLFVALISAVALLAGLVIVRRRMEQSS